MLSAARMPCARKDQATQTACTLLSYVQSANTNSESGIHEKLQGTGRSSSVITNRKPVEQGCLSGILRSWRTSYSLLGGRAVALWRIEAITIVRKAGAL